MLVSNSDHAALASYFGAYGMWAEATEAIQKFGPHGEGAFRISGPIALRLKIGQ